MPKLNVEVVSAERVVFTGEADMVVAPGSMGVIGILPKHARCSHPSTQVS